MSHVMSASAHQEPNELSEEGFIRAFAGYSALMAVVFGGATALLEWRQVFVAVMITAVIIAALSLEGFFFIELFQDGWALAVTVNTTLFMAIVFWVFASETSRSLLGIGAIEVPLSSWLGIIAYVGLTAYACWTKPLKDEDAYRDQGNAILVSGGLPIAFAGPVVCAKDLWERMVPNDSDEDD